jgi:small GTP-binding protein
MGRRAIKCVVVGDENSEKTVLLKRFAREMGRRTKTFQGAEIEMLARMRDEEKMVVLSLFDSSGLETRDLSRPLVYKDANVVILCVSLINPDSLQNILLKWLVELNMYWYTLANYSPTAPVILVGVHSDKRDKKELAIKTRISEILDEEDRVQRELEESIKRDYALREQQRLEMEKNISIENELSDRKLMLAISNVENEIIGLKDTISEDIRERLLDEMNEIREIIVKQSKYSKDKDQERVSQRNLNAVLFCQDTDLGTKSHGRTIHTQGVFYCYCRFWC